MGMAESQGGTFTKGVGGRQDITEDEKMKGARDQWHNPVREHTYISSKFSSNLLICLNSLYSLKTGNY